MLGFWSKPLTTLIQLGLVALAAWPLFGALTALAVFCVLLLVWLARHLRNLYQLRQWLRNPSFDTVPQGSGMWESTFAALYRLMRRQSQSESKLTGALERFRQAGEAMPEGMVILDESDRIEWCNPQAELHFGIDLSRDAMQHVTYLVRHPQFVQFLAAQNYRGPLVLRLPRDMDVTLSVQLVPYGDKQKLLFSRDITRFERGETVRRDFIANVSHELRTPLTVLGGFLETIIDMPRLETEMTRRTLRLMRDQAQRMQRLVEDLLTLSRLESTQNAPRDERVDVPSLVRALHQDALALSAGRHSVQLQIETPDWIVGSEDDLRSAFSNLISNAIRYTPDRGEIRLRWAREGEKAAFAIEDSGIGIDVQHIPRLTERFYRVDRGRSRATGGTGLGLAIVKHVMNRHQGQLEIASEPGRGSRFTALFPPQRIAASPERDTQLSA